MRLPSPSRRTIVTVAAVVVFSVLVDLAVGAIRFVGNGGRTAETEGSPVSLPPPRNDGDVSVETAIADRRSRREYGGGALTVAELSQLCWAAQGVTDRSTGYRAAPSAGALYPLELYVVVGTPGVGDLASGVYRYRPDHHDLVPGLSGDVQPALRRAAIDQDFVEAAAVALVVCAVDERTTVKYGDRGSRRYVPMEAGHAAENVYLQAEALGLSTVSVGAFDDDAVRDVVGAPTSQRPLYVLPVGRRH